MKRQRNTHTGREREEDWKQWHSFPKRELIQILILLCVTQQNECMNTFPSTLLLVVVVSLSPGKHSHLAFGNRQNDRVRGRDRKSLKFGQRGEERATREQNASQHTTILSSTRRDEYTEYTHEVHTFCHHEGKKNYEKNRSPAPSRFNPDSLRSSVYWWAGYT